MTSAVDETQVAACAAAYFVMLSGEYLKDKLKKKENLRKEDAGCMKYTKAVLGKTKIIINFKFFLFKFF